MATFLAPKRIETGLGSIKQSGELLQTLGGKTVLVVMDAYLASPAVGLQAKLESILTAAPMKFVFYTDIVGEPTSDNVAAGVAIASSSKCDCLLAVGGGSAIDAAKGINLMFANPGLAFADIPTRPCLARLPFVAVPTTAGTGSEATRVSVITNVATGIKENPGHPAFVPDIAVLDPELMLTLPAALTASTGMDALAHAMEAYVSNKANRMTDMYAYEAMKMVGQSLRLAFNEPDNQDARQQMSLASCFAGIAFSNASTNLAHAGGRALGAKFHVPHGLSIALLLPFVMEFGLDFAQDRYAKVAVALGADPHKGKQALAAEAVDIVNGYNDLFGIWAQAKAKFFPEPAALQAAIPEMTKNALAGNGILTNLVVPTEQDVTVMFEKLVQKLSAL